MKQLRILGVACALSLSIAQVNAEDDFLVGEGKANSEIIISESPARSTRLAAAELQTYVAKISGVRLPIRAEPSADVPVQIYVGESPHAAKLGVTADRLEHGAYRIASGEKWLVHDRRGSYQCDSASLQISPTACSRCDTVAISLRASGDRDRRDTEVLTQQDDGRLIFRNRPQLFPARI